MLLAQTGVTGNKSLSPPPSGLLVEELPLSSRSIFVYACARCDGLVDAESRTKKHQNITFSPGTVRALKKRRCLSEKPHYSES